jgi:hypothetical protein
MQKVITSRPEAPWNKPRQVLVISGIRLRVRISERLSVKLGVEED